MNKKNTLVWHTEKRSVNELLPYSGNPRSISDKQMAALKKSLKQFNLVEIPAIDTNSKIIAGHQRIHALQLLGRGNELIDVRIPNRTLTKEEYERYLITSNAVTGDWDFEKLKTFDLDILLDVGFDEKKLTNIWNESLEAKDDDFEIEKEVAKIKEPKTHLGDIIELGPHRLICGDSTDPLILKRLFNKERASMIYSDPVYNIRIDYNSGIGGKQNYGGNVNDTRTDTEYQEFIRKSMKAVLTVTEPNAHVFYWCDQTYIWLMQQMYRELDISNKRVCLWIKNGQNPTPGVAFNKCYEPCVYGTRGKPYVTSGIENLNEVMNKETSTGNNLLEETLDNLDIWAVKRLSGKEYEHATSKPPRLHEKAIRRCTKPGDIILDSFGGSGSTLIAAHQLKRRAFLVELEPLFCDLIIKRFEKLTGTKAHALHA